MQRDNIQKRKKILLVEDSRLTQLVISDFLHMPDTKCYFCRRDEALDKKAPIESEVERDGCIWDTWWIP